MENSKDKQEKIKNIPKKENTIKYEGKVKVSIGRGKKIISSKTYHNNGGIPLFDFLLSTISGSMNEEYRPKYIKLFQSSGSPTEGITSSSTQVCTVIPYNTISNIEYGENNVGRCICIHFTIPCSYLSMNSSTSISINQAGLYCSAYGSTGAESNYSAYFNFLNDAGDAWDPITVSSWQGDYNIFIEWTLTLK